MTDYTLLQQDKHLILDRRHPVDPITGAQIVSGWTHGFENKLLMLKMRNLREGQALEARLFNLDFEGMDEDYGERVIEDSIFCAWGMVRESRRKLYYYVIFSALAEREFVRWKVFGKA